MLLLAVRESTPSAGNAAPAARSSSSAANNRRAVIPCRPLLHVAGFELGKRCARDIQQIQLLAIDAPARHLLKHGMKAAFRVHAVRPAGSDASRGCRAMP